MALSDHQALFLGSSWSFFGIALILCCTRFYVRVLMLRTPALDDVFLLGALASALCMMIFFTLQTRYTLGRHVWDITASDNAHGFVLLHAELICYCIATGLAKISIAIQYLRIFRTFRIFCWICYITIGFLFCWILATLLVAEVFCKLPKTPSWNAEVAHIKCQVTTWLVHGSISVGVDLFLILLSIPIILKLQTARRQKLFILALFAIGSAGCVICLIRVLYIARPPNPYDSSYNDMAQPILTALECHICVACAAFMALRPLLIRWFPSLLRHGEHRSPAAPVHAAWVETRHRGGILDHIQRSFVLPRRLGVVDTVSSGGELDSGVSIGTIAWQKAGGIKYGCPESGDDSKTGRLTTLSAEGKNEKGEISDSTPGPLRESFPRGQKLTSIV